MSTSVATFLMFQAPGAARAAVDTYVATIPDSRIEHVDDSGGDAAGPRISFTLAGAPMVAFQSPPVHDFHFTPSTSVFVTVDDPAEVDRIFGTLCDGGAELMPLGSEYGFAQRFGWCVDRWGVSWQVSSAT